MDTAHLSGPDSPPTGQEPMLGGGEALDLTGFEPMLGGIRRVGVDMARVQALINAPGEAERRGILEHVRRVGQVDLYAQELAQVVPARARRRTGNWRGSFTPGERCQAMEVLAEVGGYESIVPLLESLDDDNYEVRKAAERALTAIYTRFAPDDRRTRIAYHALVAALKTPRPSGRKVVARLLSGAPVELVLGPLLRDGLGDGEWWVRREAAWVLGRLGDRRATRRLIAALDDPSPAVRSSAAWALGRLDAPIAFKPLADRLLGDRDEVVRAAAVEALGEHAARLSALDDAFLPTLAMVVAGLRDPDISVRHATREVLAALSAMPEARRALRGLIQAR